jgi:hypothetical protein
MNECIPVDQLGTLKQLSAEDPRRRHASACPRCSSLLFAFEAFVEADAADGANPVAAEMQLARFIATNVEQKEPERVSGAPRRERGRWFDLSFLRFAAAAAAVVVVVVVVARWQPWESKEIVYRGEASAQFTGLRASATPDGTVELHWDAVKNADAYRVTILAEDLSEITRFSPGASLSARADVRGITGTPYYWQVTALLEGAEILTSDPQRLP